MTDTKPDKPKRNTSAPLRAAIALDRVRAILADQADRIAEARAAIVTADADKIQAIVARVTDAKETEDLFVMAKALDVFLPARIAAPEADPSPASPPAATGGADEVPAEPRGTTAYVPGPAAQRARAR